MFLTVVTKAAVPVDLDRRIALNIVAGTPLELALFDIAERSAMLFSASTTSLAGRRTPAIHGTYTVSQALALLLKDTGLSYRVLEDTVFVYRLASGGTAPDRRPETPRPRSRTDERITDGDSSVVVVLATGTHIPDSPLAMPEIIIHRDLIEAEGFQTVGDVLRSQPPFFAGGLNPGAIAANGGQNTVSQSAASTANLHGLGSMATLTLINGHRVATSEGSGAVDVTLIPISAVERIEVLSGGGSALYGSDAVAGVVNIILRTNFQGVQVSAARGIATEGGAGLQHYSLIGGHTWDDAQTVALQDCAWQNSVNADQRSYIPPFLSGTTLLPMMRYCSTFLRATRGLPGDVESSLQGVYTKRANYQAESLDALAPKVAESLPSNVVQYMANADIKVPLGSAWTSIFSAGISADNVSSPLTLLAGGTPYQQESNYLDDRLVSLEARTEGTALETVRGPLRLALGAGYNREAFSFGNTSALSISAQRRVSFAFAEAAIPLLASASDTRAQTLTLDLAGRAEWYSDIGSTMNPKIGLQYEPSHDIRISASWGTSFRAPSLLQQHALPSATLEWIPDLNEPAGERLTLFRFGGNAQLHAEKSHDSTLGLTFTPSALPGASVHLQYYNIAYSQRIDYPTANAGNPLSDPNVAPFSNYSPSAAEIAQILAQSSFRNLTAGQYSPTQATLVIDDRNQNISRQRASGVDFLSSYAQETPIGRMSSSLGIAYLDLRQQATTTGRLAPLSGTVFYPPVWRSRFGVSWSNGAYSGSIHVNYSGPSLYWGTLPQQPVASWTTFDTQWTYNLSQSRRWGNTQLSLSMTNVFDRRPPFFKDGQPGWGNVNYDWTNASPLGRFITGQMTIAW